VCVLGLTHIVDCDDGDVVLVLILWHIWVQVYGCFDGWAGTDM
jgi:hypothetical protein